ncbi:MAG: hypothetical protein K9H61_01650 [Bacteroidia bacterium]|nr:hypothetical protein [Bacteroidia bacterium]MCF8425623.1 hypothetical protein [Bacteroidia bacterium]MCF8445674.1 hypothetical protein [Bacteroidia bacterium]
MYKTLVQPTRLQKTIAANCFVLIFLFLSNPTIAQTIAFSGGISLPSGLYGSRDFTNKDAGLAKTGYALNIIFEDNRKNRIVNPFLQFTHNTNTIDQDAVEKYVRVLNPTIIGLQTYKPWTQNLLMAGAKFNYFNSNYTLFAKLGVGLAWNRTFGYAYYDTLSGYDIIKRKVASENSLAINLGFGTNIYLNDKVSLVLSYDYFNSQPNFGKPAYVDASGNNIGSSESYESPFQTSTITLGLCFQLNRVYQKKF